MPKPLSADFLGRLAPLFDQGLNCREIGRRLTVSAELVLGRSQRSWFWGVLKSSRKACA